MHYYECDYPGCDYTETSPGLGGTKGMVHITVSVMNSRKSFHVCNDHAKAIGLNPENTYQTADETLLEHLAEFVKEIAEEVQQQ